MLKASKRRRAGRPRISEHELSTRMTVVVPCSLKQVLEIMAKLGGLSTSKLVCRILSKEARKAIKAKKKAK